MSVHIKEAKENIAKIVLMPGDPKRAKFIADNYLKDVIKINGVRNMDGYTGFYNGKLISVIPSGMGIPSMGIYSHELYTEFDVDTIIRIGTCGTFKKEVGEVILAKRAVSFSNFSYEYCNLKASEFYPDEEVTAKILEMAKELKLDITEEVVYTTDAFYKTDISIEQQYDAIEMETYGLFCVAKHLNKKAASLLTVSDVINTEKSMTSEEREQKLLAMIDLALKAITD